MRAASAERRSPAPRSADSRLRAGLLMPLAALAVHQGRYYLAFGSHTPAKLLRDGHAYLASVEPLVLLAAALAVGVLVGQIARAWQGLGGSRISRAAPPPRRRRTLRLWALCSLVLLALYCSQELCEGAFATGHPAGLTGIVGHGGWIAIPLALLVGAGLTAALRTGDALVELAARQGRVHCPVTAPVLLLLPVAPVQADWRLAAASGVSAGRAPPVTPACL